MKIDERALARIRTHLDEAMFAMVDFRLSFEAPLGPTGFPSFELLRKVVARLDAPHRTLFRLLRIGEAVEAAPVERSLPAEVLRAFERTGLLRCQGGLWQTPSLLLVPIEGHLVFVSVPLSYPTATRPCTVWFDLSSYVVSRALPASLAGRRVLDICSGSGIQSLLCSTRGATSVTGLELSQDAVELARLNAVLNRADAEFRLSDKLSALKEGERFDFVLCNTPYAPVTPGSEAPTSLDGIGNSVLLGLLNDLPAHVSRNGQGILAMWRLIGSRLSHGQRACVAARLEAAGMATLAFVDRAPDGLEGVFRILQADVEQRHGAERAKAVLDSVQALVREAGADVDGCYNQLVFFKKGVIECADETRMFGLADQGGP